MEPERWIETRLWFSRFDLKCYERLLLSFVKPVVESLEGSNSIKTFHFLFEPGPHFLLRIQPNTGNQFGEVKNPAEKYLKKIDDFIVVKTEQELFTDYPGESADFGADGWEIAKKVFEYGSRMAIGKLDPEFHKGRKFQEGKILHCFLNSLGYSFDNFEALYHLDEFIGRILILDRKQAIDAAIEKKIRETLNKQLDIWRTRKIDII